VVVLRLAEIDKPFARTAGCLMLCTAFLMAHFGWLCRLLGTIKNMCGLLQALAQSVVGGVRGQLLVAQLALPSGSGHRMGHCSGCYIAVHQQRHIEVCGVVRKATVGA
jgi:hypothetical protein